MYSTNESFVEQMIITTNTCINITLTLRNYSPLKFRSAQIFISMLKCLTAKFMCLSCYTRRKIPINQATTTVLHIYKSCTLQLLTEIDYWLIHIEFRLVMVCRLVQYTYKIFDFLSSHG